MICLPKEEGGLGVNEIEKQNEALLLKNLHMFFHKHDNPWVKLIWDKALQKCKVIESYKESILLAPGHFKNPT